LDARPIRSAAGEDELHIVEKMPQNIKGPDGLAETLVLLDRSQSEHDAIVRRYSREIRRFDGSGWNRHGGRNDRDAGIGDVEPSIALRLRRAKGDHSPHTRKQPAIQWI